MKKVLSILCIMMLCLPAVAQKKTASKSSKKSTTTATYSGGSSSRAASVGHHKGQFGITANVGFSGGNTINVAPDPATGQPVSTTTPLGTSTFDILVGVNYFVLDKLEIGAGIGYSNTKTFLGQDANNQDRYRNNGLFQIAPYVGYHIPICSWLHYVPQLELSLGFGSQVTDITINPKTQQTGSSTRIALDLALINFEILASKHFSLTLNVGGFSFVHTKMENVNGINTSRTSNNFAMNLVNGGFVGFRYYFN